MAAKEEAEVLEIKWQYHRDTEIVETSLNVLGIVSTYIRWQNSVVGKLQLP